MYYYSSSYQYLHVKTQYNNPVFVFTNYGHYAIAGNIASSGSPGVTISYDVDHYKIFFGGYDNCAIICAGKILGYWGSME